MKNGNIFLVDLEFEYKIWKNRLNGYLSEIEIIKSRNVELVSTKRGKELNTVELMVLEEHASQLNQLLNLIKVQEQEMQYYNKDFPITGAHDYIVDHKKIRSRMERLCTIHLEKVEDLIQALGI
jgi:hypothetical protein